MNIEAVISNYIATKFVVLSVSKVRVPLATNAYSRKKERTVCCPDID